MKEADSRRSFTEDRITELKKRLPKSAELCEGKACVYATGSYGRLEAGPHSDLDVFIVGQADAGGKRLLPRLDEILVKAELISAARELKLPEFSGDGAYLQFHSVSDLIGKLGSTEDDSRNTFTARLLMLLEGRPLVESAVFEQVADRLLGRYWADFEDHCRDFVPGFFANDVLRLWRTFCLNYEAFTENDPPESRAKRRLKLFKLKHSRLLTCFSGILYLLAEYSGKGTVSRSSALDMVRQSPIERVRAADRLAKVKVSEPILGAYAQFLEITNRPEADLVSDLMDPDKKRSLMERGDELGLRVYEALQVIGNGNFFHRVLLV